MPGRASLQRSVLDALDPRHGGRASASVKEVLAMLRGRRPTLASEEVAECLGLLVKAGRVERVVLEEGDVVYTRPEVLLSIPGLLTLYPAKRRGRGQARRP